jgi:ABC-type multidrug transport system fused ATPase/permease subunit
VTFPVASPRGIRAYLGEILRTDRRQVATILVLYGLAAAGGLVGPRVIGRVVSTEAGTAGHGIDAAAAIFLVALLVQSGATKSASRHAGTLTARLLSRIRTGFVEAVLAMPVGIVEAAGTGELQTRASSDVEQLTYSVREAAPQMAIAAVQTVLTVAALVWTAPVMAAALVPVVPALAIGTRWYLTRARPAYENLIATYDKLNARVQETATAGRTIETFGLGHQRTRQIEDDISRWIETEWYALRLRTIYFPITEACYIVPLVLAVLVGGLLHASGHLSIAAATASALYVQLLIDPVDTVLGRLDELQLGGAALSRLLGVREVVAEPATEDRPSGEQVAATGLHYAYRTGRDVLCGIDFAPAPGSRVALVGPSGAGKSTLALLLTGVHPPRLGTVTIGGVDAYRLPTERLRAEIALVTQEYHLFNATLRENLELVSPGATDDTLRHALEVVDAGPLLARLADGLDTKLGAGAVELSPSEAQQVALARLVLADPHTLVLDEATALLDPRAARHLERSLAAVLEGRTVIAVAHRLQTAKDADVIAVIEAGRITERGSHDELIMAGGSYAALWRSWQGA